MNVTAATWRNDRISISFFVNFLFFFFLFGRSCSVLGRKYTLLFPFDVLLIVSFSLLAPMALPDAEDRAVTPLEYHEPFEESPTVQVQLDPSIADVALPMENLPALQVRELRSMGRSVTLFMRSSLSTRKVAFVFQGVISMITRDCINLFYFMRYTHDEYMEHQKTVAKKKILRKPEEQLIDLELVAENSFPDESGLQEDPNPFSEAYVISGDRMGNIPSSGPHPFVTIRRKMIVSFILGSSNAAHFVLFQNPLNHPFDMQCLRVFVRRYLVLTSQGQNRSNVSLKEYISVRLNCSTVDDELLAKVANEELELLLNVNGSILKVAPKAATSQILMNGGRVSSPRSESEKYWIGVLLFLVGLTMIVAAIITVGLFVLCYVAKNSVIEGIPKSVVFCYIFPLLCLLGGCGIGICGWLMMKKITHRSMFFVSIFCSVVGLILSTLSLASLDKIIREPSSKVSLSDMGYVRVLLGLAALSVFLCFTGFMLALISLVKYYHEP